MNTNTTATATKKGIAPLSPNAIAIGDYEGNSIRKFAEALRRSGEQLPRLYYYVNTFPIRLDGGKKVIIKGRYAIAAKTAIGIESLSEIAARLGYKIRTTAKTEVAAKELLADLKAAINQTGKYAPKPKKIRGMK